MALASLVCENVAQEELPHDLELGDGLGAAGAPGVMMSAHRWAVGAPGVMVGAHGVVVGAPGVMVGAPAVVGGAPGVKDTHAVVGALPWEYEVEKVDSSALAIPPLAVVPVDAAVDSVGHDVLVASPMDPDHPPFAVVPVGLMVDNLGHGVLVALPMVPEAFVYLYASAPETWVSFLAVA